MCASPYNAPSGLKVLIVRYIAPRLQTACGDLCRGAGERELQINYLVQLPCGMVDMVIYYRIKKKIILEVYWYGY